MAYRVFTIPLAEPGAALEQLNQFLAGHQVVEVDRQFQSSGAQAFWHFCVNYVPALKSSGSRPACGVRQDYKEELEDDDFSLFAKLRTLRKEIAEGQSTPVFAIFTNAQLAEMAERRVTTPAQMREINGIGEKKVASFAEAFLAVIRAHGPKPDGKGEKQPTAAAGGKLF